PGRRPLARGRRAGRGTEHLVRRGLAQRARASYGVRPPVRAHYVPWLNTSTGAGALRADREGRRLAERLDLAGPHERLRDAARALPRAGSLAGERPTRLAASRDDAGEARQPARCREERAALARRQPAVRRLGRAHPGTHVSA